MKKAKLFQNGQSQAVRLPKEAVVLIPANHSWDALADSLGKFSADFMKDRNQPSQQTREDLFA